MPNDKKEYLKYKGALVTVQKFKEMHKKLAKAKTAPKKKVVKKRGGIPDEIDKEKPLEPYRPSRDVGFMYKRDARPPLRMYKFPYVLSNVPPTTHYPPDTHHIPY